MMVTSPWLIDSEIISKFTVNAQAVNSWLECELVQGMVRKKFEKKIFENFERKNRKN